MELITLVKILLKDQNLQSLHKNLRHSYVKRYVLVQERHDLTDIKGSDRLKDMIKVIV